MSQQNQYMENHYIENNKMKTTYESSHMKTIALKVTIWKDTSTKSLYV